MNSVIVRPLQPCLGICRDSPSQTRQARAAACCVCARSEQSTARCKNNLRMAVARCRPVRRGERFRPSRAKQLRGQGSKELKGYRKRRQAVDLHLVGLVFGSALKPLIAGRGLFEVPATFESRPQHHLLLGLQLELQRVLGNLTFAE